MATTVKGALRQFKNSVMSYDEAEVRVREATSNDNWGASSSLMHEIADDTRHRYKYQSTLNMITKRLTDYQHLNHVLKSLILIEFLMKNGDMKFVQDMQDRKLIIKRLRGYKYYKENKELGSNVRKWAVRVMHLLENADELKKERETAKNTRGKIQGISNENANDLRWSGDNGSRRDIHSQFPDKNGGMDSPKYDSAASPKSDVNSDNEREKEKEKEKKKTKKKPEAMEEEEGDGDGEALEEKPKKKGGKKKGKKGKKKDEESNNGGDDEEENEEAEEKPKTKKKDKGGKKEDDDFFAAEFEEDQPKKKKGGDTKKGGKKEEAEPEEDEDQQQAAGQFGFDEEADKDDFNFEFNNEKNSKPAEKTGKKGGKASASASNNAGGGDDDWMSAIGNVPAASTKGGSKKPAAANNALANPVEDDTDALFDTTPLPSKDKDEAKANKNEQSEDLWNQLTNLDLKQGGAAAGGASKKQNPQQQAKKASMRELGGPIDPFSSFAAPASQPGPMPMGGPAPMMNPYGGMYMAPASANPYGGAAGGYPMMQAQPNPFGAYPQQPVQQQQAPASARPAQSSKPKANASADPFNEFSW